MKLVLIYMLLFFVVLGYTVNELSRELSTVKPNVIKIVLNK